MNATARRGGARGKAAGVFSFLILVLPFPAAAQQQSLGIFGLWGAFSLPGRCHAVSEPDPAPRGADGRPYASVGYWPGRAIAGQPYFRLSRAKRAGSAVLLRIDERTFQLKGGGVHAWPVDRAADAAVIAAMRTGLAMRVESRAESGVAIRDSYRLRGAATAIDAAAIACARRR
jgi:hypothetical protein